MDTSETRLYHCKWSVPVTGNFCGNAYVKGILFSDPETQTYVKPEAEITIFELLMMSGVSELSHDSCRQPRGCNYSFELLMMSGVSELSHDSWRQPQTYVKPEAAITVFELLMMSGVSELSHDSCRQPQTYVKLEAAITVFELLMMSGMSLETC